MRSPQFLKITRHRVRADHRLRCIALLALVGTLTLPGLGAEHTQAKAPASYYVTATGHLLAEPFLSYWANQDGLAAFGLPVSEPLQRDGKPTQYFQYGYVQAKSIAAKGNLTQRPVGADLLRVQGETGQMAAGRRVGGLRAGTSHQSKSNVAESDAVVSDAISGRIESYYRKNGGAARFGAALTDSYVSFGKRMQWFENGRLQWSLDDGNVEIAPVGLELARSLGIDTGAIERDGQPLFSAKRFRTFHGDGTVPEAPGRFAPVHIKIPAIKIDAKVEDIGITAGVMDVPKDAWNVGWYSPIAKPGERTNVVMAGHKDWWGIGPVVFWNLDKLKVGDKIYLTAKNGKGATYEVTKSWSIPSDTDAGVVIDDAGAETLTLITCGGAFNGVEYLSRQIIRAERI